jgi:oxygen-independent coproporphyrinogen-3 oxidase
MRPGARHLYVHVPFCAHRCGYCDFVTLVGRSDLHGAYVDAVLTELELERAALAEPLETVFVGGGTPTFTAPEALLRLLERLPAAEETTVEANPETLTSALAELLRGAGVTRVSVGAQSFQPHLLSVLERRAGREDVRRAVYALRDAKFDNISLDLLYGIPGQSPADLHADLGEALALAPEHLSCYELEAKPGTRFTHAHGAALVRQAGAMESYYQEVVETLVSAGYRWYETANFCLSPERAAARDLRARHNLGYWRGHDYLGVGIGAVSTLAGMRWRNTPRLGRYLDALSARRPPPREHEPLDRETRLRERAMLALRLDESLALAEVAEVVDRTALVRLERLGLVARVRNDAGTNAVRLTERGRYLADAVTAELLVGPPATTTKVAANAPA